MNGANITTFYVLDLDRTLLDTVKAADLFRQTVAEWDIQLSQLLAREVEDYSLRGTSFSMRDFIAERVGEERAIEIEAAFIRAVADQNLLNDGARELMAAITALPDADFGILTYGSPAGQLMKIRAAGLSNIQNLVTREAFKGQQITSWRDDDGFYCVPDALGGARAATVVLIDDKSFSFQGLAPDCRGYWVSSRQDDDENHPIATVRRVSTLFEVVDQELAFVADNTVKLPASN